MTQTAVAAETVDRLSGLAQAVHNAANEYAARSGDRATENMLRAVAGDDPDSRARHAESVVASQTANTALTEAMRELYEAIYALKYDAP